MKGHPRGSLVFDLHCDAALRMDEGHDLSRIQPDGHFDLVRARRGGLGAIFLAAWIDPATLPSGAAGRALALLGELRRFVASHPKAVGLATGAGDVARLHAAGKLAILISIEGGHALEDDLRLLETYAALGVRSITLTWSNSNSWADASTDPVVTRGGLTPFGRRVVREMNRLGMVVDLAHVSPDTFYDAIETSRAPVMVTHAGMRALADHPRNVDDAQLRAVARNGGVVGVAFYPRFLSEGPTGGVGVDDVVAHVDHAVSVAGIDHVAIGSDFDGIGSTPRGLEDVSRYPVLSDGLRRNGYSDAAMRKILGANALRVLRAATGH